MSCQFVATTGGIGDFIVASATAGNKTPTQASAKDAGVYEYYAAYLTQYERGRGTWNSGATKLVRTTIRDNTDGLPIKVNFVGAPTIDVYPTEGDLEPGFPIATAMLFQQTAAPLGWTKQTTHNDKALRVVSGTASSGGSNSFSSVFAQTVVGSHTVSTGEFASHAHSVLQNADSGTVPTPGCFGPTVGTPPAGTSTGAAGGGGSHNHAISMNILYVDLIIATKD